MSKIKPIHIMNDEYLGELEKAAVLEGLCDLVGMAGAGVGSAMDVKDFGVWRNSGYRIGKSLVDFQSIDWYLAKAFEASRSKTQLNGHKLMQLLEIAHCREKQGYYDLVIVTPDMYAGTERSNFCIGLAIEGMGTVISTFRFANLDDEQKRECIKTEAMHEIGHVFGLIPPERTYDVEQNLGKHCTNRCIMRQGITLPDDWIDMTRDRLRHGALCGPCREDLRKYFRE